MLKTKRQKKLMLRKVGVVDCKVRNNHKWLGQDLASLDPDGNAWCIFRLTVLWIYDTVNHISDLRNNS